VTTDAISLMIEPRERPVGNGVVHRLLPWRRHRMVGPFIFADHIGPDTLAPGVGVDVDAHPHIGLSTLTYLFAGRFVHRDSTGAVETIEPGDVNWMTAGRGVTHTERTPAPRDGLRDLHGLQTWVALPTETENGEPHFEHHAAATLPSDGLGGATVRVAAGDSWGMRSPVGVSSPLVLAELRLDDGASLAIDDTHTERAVLAIDGTLTLAGRELPAGHLAVLTPQTRPRLEGRGRAMALGGEPVGPRHIWWNFVHSDLDHIEDAKQRWTRQEFPKVPDDHEPWVPLPS
jgi:redox-sensitive bicupin YhaK (pirin superfamily)